MTTFSTPPPARTPTARRLPPTRSRPVAIGFVFLWFFLGGIAHFAATATEMRIVPPWMPWPREAVLVSGVLELLGAAGLLWRPARRMAAGGLFLLTLAVTPAHVYMLQRAELFPGIPVWAMWLRLPIQLGLLAVIASIFLADREARR